MTQLGDSLPPENRAFIRESGQRIVQMYTDWHKPDQAASWRAKIGLTGQSKASTE